MAKGGARAGAGRPRKPAEVHEAQGTYRPDRHARSDALPVSRQRPACPPSFGAAQKKAWEVIVDDLEELGILAHSDGYVIEVAAALLGRARDARRKANARGVDVDAWHKLVKLEADCLNRGKTAAEQLGLSPSARHRLGMQLSRPQGGSPSAAAPSPSPAPDEGAEPPAAGSSLGLSPRLALAPPPKEAAS